MKNNTKLTVTINNQKTQKGFEVFGTNKEDRFVFGVKNLPTLEKAEEYAEQLANRMSCEIETIN